MDFLNKVFLLKKDSPESKSSYLFCENGLHHNIFKYEKNQSLDQYVKEIGENFTLGNTQAAVAQLLLLIPQCPKSQLTKNGEKWIKHCFHHVNRVHVDVVPTILTVVNFILKSCHENKDLYKSIQKSDCPILEQLRSLQSQCCEAACSCIYEYLILFPNQALPYKSKLESMSVSCLNLPLDSSESAVASAARVFATLPLPGSAGYAPEAKGTHLDKLISLAHCAMDVVFRYVDECEEYEFSRDHNLPYTTLSSAIKVNEPIELLVTSIPILCHCLVFIQEFIISGTSNFISLKPRELISVAFRILQVDPKILKKSPSIESSTLAFLLPSLHLRTLKFLRHLVANGICTLFLNLVEEQVVDVLKTYSSSSSSSSGKNSELSEDSKGSVASIKTVCYQCLKEVVTVSNGGQIAFLEHALPVFVTDVRPNKDRVLMRSAVRGSRLGQLNASKKSKKKGYTVQEVDPSSGPDGTMATPKELEESLGPLTSALEYVEAVVLHGHHSLDVKHYRMIYNHLLRLAEARKSWASGFASVRAALFRALTSIALHPHPLCPPNYVVLFNLFQRGVADPDSEVALICSRGLASLSFVMANPSVLDISDVIRLNSQANANEDKNEILELNGDEDLSSEDEDPVPDDEDSKEDQSSESDRDQVEDQKLSSEVDCPEEQDDESVSVMSEDEDIELDRVSDDDEVSAPLLIESKDNGVSVAENNHLNDEVSDSDQQIDNLIDALHLKRKMKSTEQHLDSVTCQTNGLRDEEESLKGSNKKGTNKRAASKDSSAAKKKKPDAVDSPSIQEMLQDFVDADPDSD